MAVEIAPILFQLSLLSLVAPDMLPSSVLETSKIIDKAQLAIMMGKMITSKGHEHWRVLPPPSEDIVSGRKTLIDEVFYSAFYAGFKTGILK